MADLRTAAQQALEALENAEDQLAKPYSTDASNAITALRAALAEPARTRAKAIQDMVATSERAGLYELTAEPVQRKPLTEDEIWGLAANCLNSVAGQLQFARAIEAAHGIKEPK